MQSKRCMERRRAGEIFSSTLLYIGINLYCVISYTHFLRLYGVIIMVCCMNHMTAGINMKNAIMISWNFYTIV